MSLLFDENLSPSLPGRLQDIFPSSVHARDVGLTRVDDAVVWSFAAANGLAIISKDADFRQMAFLQGPPPKVIAISLGNCSTDLIEKVLRGRTVDIRAFLADPHAALLLLPSLRILHQ